MPGILIHEVSYSGEVTDLFVGPAGITIAPTADIDADTVLPGHGLLALPGLLDVHVHFRDPGLTAKEDLLSGARAAAAGGFTTVLCEPNTRPVMDKAEELSAFRARVAALALPLGVHTKAAVSMAQAGETLTDIPALTAAGAVALSDDGEPLVNYDLLVRAFRATGTLILTAHCEETPRSAATVAAVLGVGAPLCREVELIRLHLTALADAGMGRLHIQHVSLAASVDLIAAAKRQGLAVTAEVTPHHLLLCAEEIPSRADGPDANWKMNPPLRARADMLAMRRALADGVIDVIATDHAPHTAAEKARGWCDAPFGIIGLETALGAAFSLIHDGTLTLAQLATAMSTRPATLLPAWARPCGDLVLIDPAATWTVDPEKFYSKARNCPFAGMTFTGKATHTIARGRLVMAEGMVLF